MMNIKVNVKHNYKNFDSIIQKLPQIAEKITTDIIKNIQGYAIRLEKGHNETGIVCEIVDTSTKEVKGRVVAKPEEFMAESNISYLWFEYFGTGSYAEKEHIGTSKHFIESSFTEWFIPVNKVGRSLGYPIVTIQGQDFYIAHGMQGNHFLEDGEFQSRNENKEIAQKTLNEMIKEACK